LFFGDCPAVKTAGYSRPSFGWESLKKIAFKLKIAILKIMEATAYRYLTNVSGVCSGNTIIENTRIGVHDVMGLLLNGTSMEDVLRSFPGLTKAQIYECLAYYEDHRTEIDALVTEQMSETL
jgi:uncharacterized protein (DUF433 family)